LPERRGVDEIAVLRISRDSTSTTSHSRVQRRYRTAS
jgi:hypothetical protein